VYNKYVTLISNLLVQLIVQIDSFTTVCLLQWHDSI